MSNTFSHLLHLSFQGSKAGSIREKIRLRDALLTLARSSVTSMTFGRNHAPTLADAVSIRRFLRGEGGCAVATTKVGELSRKLFRSRALDHPKSLHESGQQFKTYIRVLSYMSYQTTAYTKRHICYSWNYPQPVAEPQHAANGLRGRPGVQLS